MFSKHFFFVQILTQCAKCLFATLCRETVFMSHWIWIIENALRSHVMVIMAHRTQTLAKYYTHWNGWYISKRSHLCGPQLNLMYKSMTCILHIYPQCKQITKMQNVAKCMVLYGNNVREYISVVISFVIAVISHHDTRVSFRKVYG